MTEDPLAPDDGEPTHHDYGMSIGDVMSVLLMFFILLYVVALLKLQEQEEQIVERRVMVIMALQEALEEKDIELAVDPSTGDVSLTDSILFAEGSSQLKREGRQFLRAFIPTYADVIFSDPLIEEEVVRVVVEGHTSSKGSEASNLSLSLRRADSVTSFIARDLEFPHRDRFLIKLLGAGRGETEADQSIDDPADRKVVFRFQFRGSELTARLEGGALRAGAAP